MSDHWLTVLVAMIAVVIAYRQWRTAHDKLRFDLYARRLAVYDATMDYIEMSIKQREESHPGDEEQVRTNFIRAWREARFLFGKDSKVYGTLSEMQTHVSIVMTPIDPAIVLYNEQAHKLAIKRRQNSLNWIWTSSEQLADAFEPFLDFRKLQNFNIENAE